MFVTVEGVDGAGKSTVVDALAEEQPDATFTREPTDSWLGDAVGRALDDEGSNPLVDLFLFTADHADHVENVVQRAVDAGDLLVCDRYVDSRIAYQGVTLEDVVPDPLEYVREIHEPWTVYPDITLLLDLAPEEAIERLSTDVKYENESHLRRVRDNYLSMAEDEPERFEVVDASRPLEEVVADCVDLIRSRM